MESPGSREVRLRGEVESRKLRHGNSSADAPPPPSPLQNSLNAPRPPWASPTKRQMESPAERNQRMAAEVRERTRRELMGSGSKFSSYLEEFVEKPVVVPVATEGASASSAAAAAADDDEESLPLHLGAIVEVPRTANFVGGCGSESSKQEEEEEEGAGAKEGGMLRGEIRFIGEAHLGAGLWVGIELLKEEEEEEEGGLLQGVVHDGSVDGVPYFEATRGVFVRPSDVAAIVDAPSPSTTPSKKRSHQPQQQQDDASAAADSSSNDENAEPAASQQGGEGAGAVDRAWAFGDELTRAITEQYTPSKSGRPPVDPDAIFQFDLLASGAAGGGHDDGLEGGDDGLEEAVGGEGGGSGTVCDLSAIFNRNSISYTKRYSTGTWGQDGLSVEEELVYKRGLGFLQEADDEDDDGIFLTSSPERARTPGKAAPPGDADDADDAVPAAAVPAAAAQVEDV